MFSQRHYLQWLCNKFGDFKVSTHKPDGSWTKHKSVLWCWENLDKEGWRLDTANNRTSLKNEVILDIDPEPKETAYETQERYKKLVKLLKKFSVQFRGYFSGSRGYHIHIISKEFGGEENKTIRTKYKSKLIEVLNCEGLKASEQTMISLEGAKHWKTGNKKILLHNTTNIDWEGG